MTNWASLVVILLFSFVSYGYWVLVEEHVLRASLGQPMWSVCAVPSVLVHLSFSALDNDHTYIQHSSARATCRLPKKYSYVLT
jgi:hypothetical protein